MKTSEFEKVRIKYFESIHDGNLTKIGLQPKLCPAGIWTVGWGHALYFNGKPLKVADFDMIEKYFPQFSNMSLEQADALFEDDLVKFENLVNTKLKVQVTQNEFDALISFSWNCGYSETLFSLINSRSPKDVIGQWWRTGF